MRFVWQLLFGLIIFQGILYGTAVFFPVTGLDYGENVTSDANYTQYREPGRFDIFDYLWGSDESGSSGGLAGLIIGAVGFAGALIFRSPIIFGISAFLAFFTAVYVNAFSIITSLANTYYITWVVAIIGICISISIIAIVIEAAMQQQGAG